MKSLILIAVIAGSVSVSAELKMQEKPLPIYIAQNGEQLNPVEAVKRSIKGERVLKCDQVEAQASTTGNVSLKKVK